MTLGFESQLPPRKKGLNLYYPLRHSRTYGATRPAKCEELKVRAVHRWLKTEFCREVTKFFIVLFVWIYLKFFRGLLVSFALLLLFLVQFVDQLVLMRNLVIKVTNLVVFCCFVLLRLLWQRKTRRLLKLLVINRVITI